jgi:hypothetical protein
MIKYRIFAWSADVKELEGGVGKRNVLFDRVEEFINKLGEDKIVAITNQFNAIIVWYRE